MATLGEQRVRYTFNPGGSSVVDQIKLEAAHEIDQCEMRKQRSEDGEARRLWALAQTAYEEAAMWAVKAATYEGNN